MENFISDLVQPRIGLYYCRVFFLKPMLLKCKKKKYNRFCMEDKVRVIMSLHQRTSRVFISVSLIFIHPYYQYPMIHQMKSYGIYNSQLVWCARTCTKVLDFHSYWCKLQGNLWPRGIITTNYVEPSANFEEHFWFYSVPGVLILLLVKWNFQSNSL